ncbi:type II secretion system F family protein [Dactylosporangium matsuzakiense]|uniref:Type II secretion system protein GspF domain-containing protein n=1 Tax=Dactylosporangium matsuzakiense TaxID=53360 RepID=A0A9W6KCB5_9ACTN|nr:type II secretion system F family protein [Dactylosporangium matsuzakiense]GLK98852.1 hypothetical protein GCM10017581_005930 [Dactylosporangium matsuzakiense]
MRGWRRWPAALLAGAAVGLGVGGRPGIAVGAGVAAVLFVVLGRVEPGRVRRERAVARSDLPFAADRLAAALRAGSSPDRAVLAVGEVLGGPVGRRLLQAGRALRRGAAPEAAWAHLDDLPGGARLGRAAARSAEHGLALTRTLQRQASDLRAAQAAAATAGVRRVGVLAMVPVAACFLPAFVLAGVVPVVVAVVRDVFTAL